MSDRELAAGRRAEGRAEVAAALPLLERAGAAFATCTGRARRALGVAP